MDDDRFGDLVQDLVLFADAMERKHRATTKIVALAMIAATAMIAQQGGITPRKARKRFKDAMVQAETVAGIVCSGQRCMQ